MDNEGQNTTRFFEEHVALGWESRLGKVMELLWESCFGELHGGMCMGSLHVALAKVKGMLTRQSFRSTMLRRLRGEVRP